MKQCKDCEWWDGRGPYGDCCKKSPVVIIDGYEVGSSAHTTVWPETGENDGCGEFQKRGEGTGDSILLLQFSIRTQNCLDSKGIKTIGQLKNTTNIELLRIRSFGEFSLREVRRKIYEYEQEKQA